ncbi:hypothetical protein T03_4165 [Trichinella britovi]|uniref:Uncharacterized protein n=1 Tax=Trichinella britovi TaxID=45882 RepID=A0A0V1CSC9_TRIBR|nr:hypothetical protein T03_4165 [Trichinella britovi]
MSFASSFINMLGYNKKANTHTQNAHESCEFQKGKKQTHFYRWRGPQSFQQRKCSQSDSISKQFNGQKEMKIAQESVDASRGDI